MSARHATEDTHSFAHPETEDNSSVLDCLVPGSSLDNRFASGSFQGTNSLDIHSVVASALLCMRNHSPWRWVVKI